MFEMFLTAICVPEMSLGEPCLEENAFGKNARDNGLRQFTAGELYLCGDEMTMFSRSLFSRPFVRKRVVSLAATTLVTTASPAFTRNPMSNDHVPGAMPVHYVNERPDYYEEAPFVAENDAAMNRMMAEMMVKPTGDADRDFVAIIAPLNRAAVEMARAEIKHGHNERLRQLAQQIIAARQQEIGATGGAADQWFAASAPPSPTR